MIQLRYNTFWCKKNPKVKLKHRRSMMWLTRHNWQAGHPTIRQEVLNLGPLLGFKQSKKKKKILCSATLPSILKYLKTFLALSLVEITTSLLTTIFHHWREYSHILPWKHIVSLFMFTYYLKYFMEFICLWL